MPTIKQLSRIMSDDVALNRVQDQLASALNPILRNVQGDLTGPLESPTVKGLRGITISQTRPTTGQALIYNGTEWAPAIVAQFITSVTAPLTVTSGVLSIPAADGTTDGYLTSANWLAFDGKVSAVTATAPMSSTGGTTPDLSMTQSNATTDGWLSAVDWVTFNSKVSGGDPTVVLLMAGTGSVGSTVFPDTSYIMATLTPNGPPGTIGIVATPTKFGGGSVLFGGSAYITAPSNAAYSFGTGDFTIEAWVYPNTMSGDYFVTSAAGTGGLFFGFRSGTNIGLGRAGVAWDYDTPSGMSPGAWYFVTLCRSGGNVRLFVDGVQVGTTQTLTYNYDLGITNLCIGSQGALYFYSGYMNDVRVSNIARYTSNFTPPVAPFPSASPPSFPPNGPAGGDLSGTYPNPTVAKIQSYSVSSTAPATDEVLAWSGSAWTPTAISSIAPEYISLTDSTATTAIPSGTALTLTYDTVEASNGMTLVGGSQITAAVGGLYEVSFSPQLEITSGTTNDMTVWLQKNGANVAKSASVVTLGNNAQKLFPYISLLINLNAGDYVEWLMTASATNGQVVTIPAGALTPVAPALIVTAKLIGP